MARQTTHLCFDGYAILHSGVSRSALWAAEYLTPLRVQQSRVMERTNSFHPEERLRRHERAELADFRGSCFDRGHLVPSGDASTPAMQHDTFSLANMIAQNPEHNQGLWAGIESLTRDLVEQRGPLYIITGPIFSGESLQRLNGRVLVPSHVYKAIYDPSTGQGGAYVSKNAPGPDLRVTSIAELEQKIGINLFPDMSAEGKGQAMKLPYPSKRRFKARAARAGCENVTAIQNSPVENPPVVLQIGTWESILKKLLRLIQ